jgi:hypothetical protein
VVPVFIINPAALQSQKPAQSTTTSIVEGISLFPMRNTCPAVTGAGRTKSLNYQTFQVTIMNNQQEKLDFGRSLFFTKTLF